VSRMLVLAASITASSSVVASTPEAKRARSMARSGVVGRVSAVV
jgi:hypothetical protein